MSFNELKAAHSSSQQRVFTMLSVVIVMAPLLSEWAIYLGTHQIGPAFPSSLCVSALGAFFYFLFLKTQSLAAVLRFSTPAVLICFSWNLYESGGIRGDNFIYLMGLAGVNGYLLGRRAAFYTTLYSVGLTLVLAFCEFKGFIQHAETPLLTATIQSSLSLVFVGCIVMIYERERSKSETSLEAAIESVKSLAASTAEIQRMAKIGAWDLNVKTMTTSWTDETYRIHGVPIGTPTNKIMGIDFYAAHERARITRLVQECAAGEPFRDTFDFIDALKNPKWVEVMGQPVFEPDGTIRHIRGTFQDVTEQIKALKELDQVIQNTPGMVYKFKAEPSGRMYLPYVSPKAFDIYEVTQEDFKANPSIMLDMAHPDDRDGLSEAIQSSGAHLTSFSWEGRIVTGTGKTRWIQARSVPQKDHDGSIIWDGVVLDVTERRKLQDSLEIERTKAMHASKLATLGEMAAGMAHEINNPLAIIEGSAQLLSKYFDQPDRLIPKIQAIQKSVDRINKIVKGLKKFSRSAATTSRQVESLEAIVRESLVITDAKAKRHNTSVTIKTSQNLFVKCDEVEIEQVIVNLINNGIDAVKNTPAPWVEIRLFEDQSDAVVQIVDSGLGISPEIEEKLFQPFFTTKGVGEGTGLGLSITRGILDQHKATIAINSTVKNTCFEVRFQKA